MTMRLRLTTIAVLLIYPQCALAQNEGGFMGGLARGLAGARGPTPEERESRAHAKVGKLVLAGKCDEALRTALKGGYFDLAREVPAWCHPAQTADK
ncbi:hypothetical protein [Sphingomonas sp.]|uniref:hypothetical protein n=1 Tax=Sphingomonas sp. TaxID=28214 RepID=UPI0025804974|nr:hypothetical protein [Sphingomonas sp.]